MIDGRGFVMVPDEVARRLAQPLREAMRENRRRGNITPADVIAVVGEFESAALSVAIEVTPAEPARNHADQQRATVELVDEDDSRKLPSMSIEAAARILGTSPSYVRRMRRSDRLVGFSTDGGWRIFEWSLGEFVAERDRKRKASDL